MSGIQKQITGSFFSRESFKPFYHLGPLCVLAYGLCSGLSECMILGYSHKHLNYRDLPRVEVELSLMPEVWYGRSRRCLDLSPSYTSSPCRDSVAPVCLDQADSSLLAHFSLPEKLKGGKKYTFYPEVP